MSQDPRPDAMAGLVARLPWDGRIRHVRNAAYFGWRFRNPLHEYRFLFRDGDGLLGYMVLQRSVSGRGDPAQVNIADWEAADRRVRDELLTAALDWGGFSHVHAWTAGAEESTRCLLEARGFTPLDRPDIRQRSGGLLVRPLGEAVTGHRWMLGSRNLLDIRDWDLRMLVSMAA